MNLATFRSQFPALKNKVWLDSPTVTPAARPVLEALRAAEDEWSRGEFSWRRWEQQANATRALFAGLIAAEEVSVALVPSLSEAAATVARSLQPGRIVVGAQEFRSNLFPWLAMASRGFEVIEVPATAEGVTPTEALLDALRPGTVLLAITSVQSSNGFRVRLAEIADACRKAGARLFVNLTQHLGALRFDLRGIDADYVAAHGYKWLLAPRGASWLYIRPDRIEELEPLAANWKSVADPYSGYYGGPLQFAKGASKLDGSLAWFPWVGANAALRLITSLDPVEAEMRCLSLASAFAEEASSRGFQLVPREEPSQIIGLSTPDAGALKERLAEHHVVAAIRGGFLRLGFHAFNDESDLEAALEALGKPN